MGSVFRVPHNLFSGLTKAMEELSARGIKTIGASQHGTTSYDQVDWRSACALLLGSEGKGFSETDLPALSETIQIPMKGLVESLNVGTAAAVCLFEAARQRRNAV
jgi:tRNA G18 (ribose-2'-O)-methylase SpoU